MFCQLKTYRLMLVPSKSTTVGTQKIILFSNGVNHCKYCCCFFLFVFYTQHGHKLTFFSAPSCREPDICLWAGPSLCAAQSQIWRGWVVQRSGSRTPCQTWARTPRAVTHNKEIGYIEFSKCRIFQVKLVDILINNFIHFLINSISQ